MVVSYCVLFVLFNLCSHYVLLCFLQAGTPPLRRMAKTDYCLSCTGTTCLRIFSFSCDQYVFFFVLFHFFFYPANNFVLYTSLNSEPNSSFSDHPETSTSAHQHTNTDRHTCTHHVKFTFKFISYLQGSPPPLDIYLSVHCLMQSNFSIATFILYSRTNSGLNSVQTHTLVLALRIPRLLAGFELKGAAWLYPPAVAV